MRRFGTIWFATCWIGMTCPSGCSGSSGAGCKTDSDCPSGRYCAIASSECVFDCVYATDCPSGYRCTGRGRCEPGCAITHGGIEDCDGVDNDCDGSTDEDVQARDCEKQNSYGTCRGREACLDHAWVCDAPVPAAERCDGADNDCDGQTDEGFNLGEPCPGQGVCPEGVFECAPDGNARCSTMPGGSHDRSSAEVCDGLDDDCDGATDEEVAPTYLPESGAERDDGRDNNCDGLTDERGGVLVRFNTTFFPTTYMTAYEIGVFENPDCTGRQYGVDADDYPAGWPAGPENPSVTLYACALPGIFPSGYLSWYRAKRACEAQGLRLCRQPEWNSACQGYDARLLPYGPEYRAGMCNEGWGSPGTLSHTGEFSECTAGNHMFDMVGNMAEWVQEYYTDAPAYHLAGGAAYACYACDLGTCHACDFLRPNDEDRFKDWGTCLLRGKDNMAFLPEQAEAWLGGRCCYDNP